MQETLQIFQYNGSGITFAKGNQLMINATEMAKPFGKQPKDWLRTQSAKDFITALSARRKCLPTDLLQVVNGGSSFGTWMHEDLAMEFARWLSPDFAIWCNDRIKELLTKGTTSLLSQTYLEALQRGQWLLSQKYADKGYHDSKTSGFIRKDGTQGSKLLTVWTQAGRKFLYDFLKERGVLPLMERQGAELSLDFQGSLFEPLVAQD